MVVSKSRYEEIRQKRLEENKKRMEELNLKKLVVDIRTTSPKTSPLAPEPLERPRRTYCYRRQDLLNRIYASDEVRGHAVDRAGKIQSALEADFPSFVKPMTQSHVTGGFWLGLPVQFCKDHLPSHDEYITLVDENGDASETKYLVEKTGLSAGWRGFTIDHKLVDGDALVFQLVSPREFKTRF
ncbi:hypothetical protein GH714_018215 [Hevea brasiliensis]|uniref:TF-B3 domain-containing protein n=1 Tax=Hevea brasiliensis TaxID=3981 RepID=A0A6A6L0F7_HEVBR|nr:hypothetical protein GH714_018215 [Hevea brasiliensis]